MAYLCGKHVVHQAGRSQHRRYVLEYHTGFGIVGDVPYGFLDSYFEIHLANELPLNDLRPWLSDLANDNKKI